MKILIIATCFAPKNVIGAVRISKLAKYLVRDGHNLTVISPELEEYDTIDKTLECEELKQINRITVPYSRITTRLTGNYKRSKSLGTANVGNKTNMSAKAKVYRLLRNAFAWWRDYEWTHRVENIIKSLPDFDVVISSYPYLSAHNVAQYVKDKGKAKYWIADFRDPYALDNSSGKQNKRIRVKQSQIVRKADRTVYVTKAGAENFCCFPDDREKVVWIPNGYDEEDFIALKSVCSEVAPPKELTFSYAGGMYHGERDCSPLFKAIRQLIDRGLLNTNSIRFRYAGTDFQILEEQASIYHLDSILENEGKIPRIESLKMQYASDCIVVATFCYRDGEGSMPGKIYEPLMMGKPILMLVTGAGHKCEAASFVKRLNVGCSYEESEDQGQTRQIEEFILNLLEDKNVGNNRYTPEKSALEDYKYENIARKFIRILTGEVKNG